MNKGIIKVVLITVLIGIVLPIYSQTQPDNFKITSKQISKDSSQIYITLDFILEDMNIESNDMVILTPTLKSNEISGEILSLPPVVITGKLRSKIIDRKVKLGNQDQLPFGNKPQIILKRKNDTTQSLNYKTSILYKEWMDNASLTIQKNISGCANCNNNVGDQLIVQNILPEQDPASYRLTYIRPNTEPIKERIDKYIAFFSYTIDNYELLKDYENNSYELAQIEKIVEEIRNNNDLVINEFSIVGYASPEGRYEYNKTLAENRANSLANHLTTTLGISRDKFAVEGKGEDWTGLYNIISNSTLTDRQDILNIIDEVQNPDMRDRKLAKLSRGNTYKTLLRDYYPKLRRTEYSITYTIHTFDVEEAKNIIKNNPKELSLNEMFLVAESYPLKSKESKYVFEIAAQIYPDSEIAIINSAASLIENRNYDQAIELLKRIENNPIAWNNLGVVYALKNDIEQAYTYLKKISTNSDAETNLKIIESLYSSN